MITDDGTGVAAELASLLQAADIAVHPIGGPDQPIDWSSPSAIDSAVERLRSQGPIAGIVHALPLARTWHGDRGCRARLGRTDRRRGERPLPSGQGHRFRSGECRAGRRSVPDRRHRHGRSVRQQRIRRSSTSSPAHGGVAGLVKTLAREWPSIRCRVVDFSPDAPRETIASQLADEIFVSDGFPEVGYEGDRRIRLRSVASPLVREQPTLELKPGEPVLISGGARGITALVAAELARTWRPTLLMVGTTPLPGDSESADTAGLTGEAEIKAALHARLRHEGQPAEPRPDRIGLSVAQARS